MVDRFRIADVSAFMSLIKILRNDNEFHIRFDHTNGHIDIESMMMAGIVAVGIHIIPSDSGMFTCHNMTRNTIDTFRVDSAGFLRVFVRLFKLKHEYFQLYVVDDTSICIECIHDNMVVGSGTINTLDVDGDDSELFRITQDEMDMSFSLCMTRKWSEWKPFFQATMSEDTTISYTAGMDKLVWTTADITSKIMMNSRVDGKEQNSCSSVDVCILPSIVRLVRNIMQFSDKSDTTVSLDTELPLSIYSRMDTMTNGGFIRILAGTKEIE